jgi:hypothetical protein
MASFRKLILTILGILLVSYAIAQPGGGGPPGDGEPVPISGIEILVAAGAFLGIRKYINSAKKR